MAKSAKWYAIQVAAGKENRIVEFFRNAPAQLANVPGLESVEPPQEVFSPRYQTAQLKGGTYVPVEKPFLPGYVIAVTRDVDGLNRMLHLNCDFTKILGSEEAFVPLSSAEANWLRAFTGKQDHVVPMSCGFKEGGRVVVTSGPLVGREAQIVKINRRKREAYVSFEMMGRKVEVKVGFRLVKKI